MSKSAKTTLRVVLLVGIGLLSYYTNQTDNKNSVAPEEPSPIAYQSDYLELRNSTLSRSKYNDGDSFMSSHDGKKQEFRLYFVDAPESRDKPYEDHKKRVRAQGRALGEIDYEATLKIGKQAKIFTQNVLKKTFTVYTKNELVYNGPRKYAFVEVMHEGKKRWLHELLIERGLARIHTLGTSLPTGKSLKTQKSYLYEVQGKAKRQKLGAWSN